MELLPQTISFGFILLQILPFFIIIFAGSILVKIKVASQSWLQPLGSFALLIGFPALIFGNLVSTPLNFTLVSSQFSHFSFVIFATVLALIIFFKIFKINTLDKPTYIITFMFGNAAFLGIPLITSLDESLAQTASINASVMLFWVFSLGLLLVEFYRKSGENKLSIVLNLFKNPLLLSVLLGLLFNYLQVQIPKPLLQPIGMLGKAVSPIVMLMIGIFIALHPPKTFKSLKKPLIYSAFKLLIFPLVCYSLYKLLHLKPDMTTLVQFAMPAAITPFAMAEKYKFDKEFICNSIIISTIVSLLTIPFIIWLVQ